MKKSKAAGVNQNYDYSHEKRQFRKRLDMWEERADQENQLRSEKSGKPQDIKRWRGLFRAIAGLAMAAYSAGIDGKDSPQALTELEKLSECETDAAGAELIDTLYMFINDAYEEGKKARR